MEKSWTIDHAGLIVNDLERGIKYYQSIGFTVEKQPSKEVWNDARYEVNGMPLSSNSAVEIREAVLRKGPFAIQMCQPLKGKNLQMDYLEKHDEGINYISFVVNDLDNEKTEMIKKGFPVIQSIINEDGTLMATYHDTQKAGNVVIALCREPILPPEKTASMENTWKIEHMGLVVKDMKKNAEFYKSLGFDMLLTPIILSGKFPPPMKMKMCLLYKSSFVIELFEHVEGESIWNDFREKYGEGINHISFAVNNIEKEHDRLLNSGFTTDNIARIADGRLSEVYYNTLETGHVYICLYQGEPRFTFEANLNPLIQIPGLIIETLGDQY